MAVVRVWRSHEEKAYSDHITRLSELGWLISDMGDCMRNLNIVQCSSVFTSNEIVRLRLCYTLHNRHGVTYEVIAGSGYKLMSFVLWLKIVIKLRVVFGEYLTVSSPLLVRTNRSSLVPMTGEMNGESIRAEAWLVYCYDSQPQASFRYGDGA